MRIIIIIKSRVKAVAALDHINKLSESHKGIKYKHKKIA